MAPQPGQPVTAPAHEIPRDGLAGAVGAGVFLPDRDAQDPNNHWKGPGPFTLWGPPCAAPGYTRTMDFCAMVRVPPGEDSEAEPGTPDGQEQGDPPLTDEEYAGLWGTLEGQHAFRIGSAVKCSTFGSPDDEAAWKRIAAEQLALTQWAQVGREMWLGTQAVQSGWTDQRRLVDAVDVTPTPGTPVPLAMAIAILEQEFSRRVTLGARQLIHVPRLLSSLLDHAGVIDTSPGSQRLWTANGTLVVAERGYPLVGGDGGADDELDDLSGLSEGIWIYTTGPIAARFGEVVHPPPMNAGEPGLANVTTLETNTRAVRAEQPAAVSWLCQHLGILVDPTVVL